MLVLVQATAFDYALVGTATRTWQPAHDPAHDAFASVPAAMNRCRDRCLTTDGTPAY